MKKFLSVLFVFIFCVVLGGKVFAQANQLVVVYPKKQATINALSTFFIGHTNPNATLTINGNPVKVYKNGSFVRVFNLHNGVNNVVLKSVLNNDVKYLNFTINKPVTKRASVVSSKPVLKPLNLTLVVVDDETPLRKTPFGDRLTPVKKGVVFNTVGFINKHYKVVLNDGSFAYIYENSAKISPNLKCSNQILKNILFNEDAKDIIIRIPMQQPVLVEMGNVDNSLSVILSDVQFAFEKYAIKSPYIKNFSFSNNKFNVELTSNMLNGYDYYYENNDFVLKIKKPFGIGLRGKTIAIDAGHGGTEKGSIGPTEVPEKDINIKIANYLKDALEKKGAKVVMTRNNDDYVKIYDRIDIAKAHNVDVLISIHNNALPDGQNPYVVHGTSTYYYHPQAYKLAQCVQNRLLEKTKFQDHGIRKGSLALVRPTMPVSILVEVGFMINPFEYADLLVPENQKAYALGILNGLNDYFRYR